MDYIIFPLSIDMPSPSHNHLALYADDTALLSQSWRPDITSHCNDLTEILHNVETETILFSKRRPPPFPGSLQIHNIFVPWASAVRYLNFALDSPFLYTRHLHNVFNKATAALTNIFPHLARHSTLKNSNKSTTYK